MPFVHSLVKTKIDGQTGWFAPVELAELTAHYVSFVIPMADKNRAFDQYTCEAIRLEKSEGRTVIPCELTKTGTDTFQLKFGDTRFWFVVRAAAKHQHALPYVGSLKHADFQYALMEIEAEDPSKLDQLCETEGAFLIGCDPFLHYAGLKKAEADAIRTP